MQALVLGNGIGFDAEYETPRPGPGEALIKTSLAGICATDLELVKGYAGFSGIPGHEFVGVVVQAHDSSRIGQRVVGDINCPCGSCPTCKRGDGNHCPDRTALGIRGKDGAFADYFTLPVANLRPVPKSLDDRAAVFAEPLAAALEITRQVHIKPDDEVAVLGDGRLGLLAVQALALTGCELTLIGRHPEKWALLKEKPIRACRAEELPEGFTARVVVDCTGNESGFSQARKLVRPRGFLVMKSTFAGQTRITPSSLVVDEITMIGSRCGPLTAALRLLASGLIEVEPLIEAEFALEKGEEAFKLAAKKGSLKVLLRPDG